VTSEVKSILHDAIPSWNGFNYQGKVGLYVCLKNILDKANLHDFEITEFQDFLNDYHIEYEWIEDFSIKSKEDYVSLHQVKHKQGSAFSDHIEAISTMLNRKNGILADVDVFKYFDFSHLDEQGRTAFREFILHEIELHGLRNDVGKIAGDFISLLNLVDVQIKDQLEMCLIDFTSLHSRAFINSNIYFHTAKPVNAPTKNISEYSGIPEVFMAELGAETNLMHLNIYMSFDAQSNYELALSDDELNAEINSLLLSLMNLMHPSDSFSVDDIKLYRVSLCSLIDQHVVERHRQIRVRTGSQVPYLQRTKPSIKFLEIYQVLGLNFRVQNDQYWNLICRENFEAAFQQQLEDIFHGVESDAEASEINRCLQLKMRLETFHENVIDQYFPDDCVNFLRKISPHRIQGDNDRSFHEQISQEDKLQGVFFGFIQELVVVPDKLTIPCKNKTHLYHPSCISFEGITNQSKRVLIDKARKGLASNHEANLITLNDIDYIVVLAAGETGPIPAGLEKITEVESYCPSPGIRDSDKHTEPKEINFIDCQQALGNINE
tara:strand:- start:3661 stop:5307 length:1647 start_codon:yes stop_codon:yes gene_type:complete